MFLPHKGNNLFAKRLAHNLQDSTVNKNQLQGIQHAELLLYTNFYMSSLLSNLVLVSKATPCILLCIEHINMKYLPCMTYCIYVLHYLPMDSFPCNDYPN